MQLHNPISVQAILIYEDNYVWVMHHSESRSVVVVDPGSATEVINYLNAHKITMTAVIITHSHWDHVTGLAELCAIPSLWEQSHPVIYGPNNIPNVTHQVAHGDRIALWADHDLLPLEVIATPGHMPEHLAYFIPLAQPILFCGDTLFSCGCGRISQGTHEQLRISLETLSELPDHTEVYCTHEYTLANIKFALAVEPQSKDLLEYKKLIERKRDSGQPSLPTTIGQQKALNPFLRYKELSIQQAVENHLQLKGLSAADVFKHLRQWKDSF